MKLGKFHFFSREIKYFGHILSTQGILLLPLKTQAIQKMHPPTTPEQVCAFLRLVGYYRKFIQDFTTIAKPLTLLTWQKVRFEWTLEHHEAFLKLKESIIQTLILHYPNPNKGYIVFYRCIRWHLHSTVIPGTEWHKIPHCFSLTHFFRNSEKMEHDWTRSLWSLFFHYKMELLSPRSTHQTFKWENANNKVNRWGLELATYNITFEWISGAQNKAADFLSWLVELPQTTPTPINILSITDSDGPAFYTRSQTH